MADNVARDWQTPSQAAATLGVSVRSVHRWVNSGKLETRTDETGRRLVAVVPGDSHSDGASAALPVVIEQAERQVQLAGAAMQQAHQQADQWRAEAKRARRFGGLGWALAAMVLMGGGVAAWWVTSMIEGQRADVQVAEARAAELADQLVRLEDDRDAATARADELAAQIVDARAAEASAMAQLDAQASRPAPWWQTWATIADRATRNTLVSHTKSVGDGLEPVADE